MSLKPTLSTEQVSGQPILGSEGHKAGEDILDRERHVPPQEATELDSFGHVVLALENGVTD